VFAHILDYLRYGSISLPLNVSKDMFLRDMDFFGIVPEEGTVKTYILKDGRGRYQIVVRRLPTYSMILILTF